jgi:hypothetical protein
MGAYEPGRRRVGGIGLAEDRRELVLADPRARPVDRGPADEQEEIAEASRAREGLAADDSLHVLPARVSIPKFGHPLGGYPTFRVKSGGITANSPVHDPTRPVPSRQAPSSAAAAVAARNDMGGNPCPLDRLESPSPW